MYQTLIVVKETADGNMKFKCVIELKEEYQSSLPQRAFQSTPSTISWLILFLHLLFRDNAVSRPSLAFSVEWPFELYGGTIMSQFISSNTKFDLYTSVKESGTLR